MTFLLLGKPKLSPFMFTLRILCPAKCCVMFRFMNKATIIIFCFHVSVDMSCFIYGFVFIFFHCCNRKLLYFSIPCHPVYMNSAAYNGKSTDALGSTVTRLMRNLQKPIVLHKILFQNV